MGRRISGWAVALAMAVFVAACTGAVPSSVPPAPSAPPSPASSPRPGGTRLSVARNDDPGHPADQSVRPAADGHDHGRQQCRRCRTADDDSPRPSNSPGPITDAGFEKIVQRGRDLGMFTGSGDFTPPDVMPGAPLGHIEIVVDGVLHELTGDPSRVIVCITAPRDPAPGTPEAFGAFWASLSDLTWLAGDLGPEAPYVADSCTPCSSAWSRPTIRRSGPRWRSGRSSNRSRRWASRWGPRPHPAAGRSAAKTPPRSDRASSLRTSSPAGSTRALTGRMPRLSRSARWCPARTSATRCSACPSRFPNMAVGAAAIGAACAVSTRTGACSSFDTHMAPETGSSPAEDRDRAKTRVRPRGASSWRRRAWTSSLDR